MVKSVVRMWGNVLPGGGRKRGTRTEEGEKAMSAVRMYCAAVRPTLVLLVVQEEHVAQIACCSLRVAPDAKGENDRRLASERAQVQLGRVDVGCDERVAVERSQWLVDIANTS